MPRMKKLTALSLCLIGLSASSALAAVDIKQSKVTQVVNDVQIISAANQQQKSAAVNDIFAMPDVLRTGPGSRAELVAEDQTVTRVGANTIFSFDPAKRTVNLKQGSLLFHSPHGKGGGTIRTGSATASVLGSTLIVTTTATGGFKVLALEDQAEISFLNGLKQKLEPGQMTFVLPGGNQLAPIVVFRLDDLTKNSQLIQGFNQSLPSLPLIQQQIDQQIKAIQSGDMSDTGLQVGDDAGPGHVKVLDENTLQKILDQNYKNPPGYSSAVASDATINQSTLTGPSIPTPPNRLFLSKPFLLTGNPFFLGQPFIGFAARNISFNTINADPLTVNLAPYATQPEFSFAATKALNIGGDVNFAGLEESDSILFSLIGGNQISVASGSTVRANVANLEWQTPTALTLNDVSIINDVGNTAFGLGSTFNLQNGAYLRTAAAFSVRAISDVALNNSTTASDTTLLNSLKAGIAVNSSTLTMNSFGVLTAAKSINVDNSVLSVGAVDGKLGLNSKSGSVTLKNSLVQANYLSVNSGDGILLDGNGQNYLATGSSSTAAFIAPNLVTMNNANLTSFANVNISAKTINLFNVAFAGLVNLKSQFGQWHNGPSQPGYVNNLGGVTYNGNLVNAANGASGNLPGTGITISTR